MVTNLNAARADLYTYAREILQAEDDCMWAEAATSPASAFETYTRRVIEANGYLKVALDSANAPDWMYPTGR